MIVNAYAVLDAFVTVLRMGLAMAMIGLAVRGLREGTYAAADRRTAVENRNYLCFLLAFLLLFLNLASWPILYLLLDSYIPHWPGVMCIYGVTQVGAGSMGTSRFLPSLLAALQILKPLLAFAGGAWFMLYLAHRAAARTPPINRVLLALLAVGGIAIVDGALEAAYLAIPKHEEFLANGCCTTAPTDAGRFTPSALVGERTRGMLGPAYGVFNAGMILALFLTIRGLPSRRSVLLLSGLLAGAALTAAVSAAFLVDVAAPAWLHLPHHHCAYDLIPRAPESLAGVIAFVLGTFAVGWAWATAWFADDAESPSNARRLVRTLLVTSFFAYLGSLALVVVEFATG
jgi:hypothetical protein